jgi:excisionase family DNA binding protein
MRIMTHYTLGTAAQACGLNKSTVLRAIKAGKISATRDEHGQWRIDPAEMHRVYPPVASSPEEQRSEQRYAPAQQRDRTDELVAELRARLDDMRNERDRARTDADTWRAAFERELAQRALPAPGNVAQAPETTPATTAEQPSRLRRAWRWMRATG